MSAELAVSYAALILSDAEVEISVDNLLTLTKAAGVSDVEPIWAQLFAKAISGQNVTEILTQFSVGGAAAGGAGAGAGAAGAAAVSGGADEAEEKEEEAKEESDDDMGFGLFD